MARWAKMFVKRWTERNKQGRSSTPRQAGPGSGRHCSEKNSGANRLREFLRSENVKIPTGGRAFGARQVCRTPGSGRDGRLGESGRRLDWKAEGEQGHAVRTFEVGVEAIVGDDRAAGAGRGDAGGKIEVSTI